MPRNQSTTARKARTAARGGEKYTAALRRLSAPPHERPDLVQLQFSGEVFQWRGPAPYYFVRVPEKQSLELKAVSSAAGYYRGTMRVTARIGDTEWTTSLWPKDGGYVVPLKDLVRKPLGIADGDTVTIKLAVAAPADVRPRARPERAERPAARTGTGSRPRTPVTDEELTILPANEASWEDLQAVFGVRGDPARCWCQRYKMRPKESWGSVGADGLADRLREQTACDRPGPARTTGLVAYLDGEPVGWCAVDPRSDNPRLLSHCRVPWVGRSEDKTDRSVWAVTCFVTRSGFRHRGISRALARAAVDFAREHGARALEGYPHLGEIGYVGTPGVFTAAGLREVSRPTNKRVVMRIDFQDPGSTA